MHGARSWLRSDPSARPEEPHSTSCSPPPRGAESSRPETLWWLWSSSLRARVCRCALTRAAERKLGAQEPAHHRSAHTRARSPSNTFLQRLTSHFLLWMHAAGYVSTARRGLVRLFLRFGAQSATEPNRLTFFSVRGSSCSVFPVWSRTWRVVGTLSACVLGLRALCRTDTSLTSMISTFLKFA